MAAVQEAQTLIGERLDAEADSVDWERSHLRNVFFRHVVGIAFHRDFFGMSEPPRPVNVAKDLFCLVGRELRRSAAAEIDGADGLVQIVFPQLHLPACRRQIVGDECRKGGRVKSAVDATARAKWNMNVKTCHEEPNFNAKILICFKKKSVFDKNFWQFVDFFII